jgi:tRNA1(Val) A37 N6-methylase TrmN6
VRRANGIYYTPHPIAEEMIRWAVDSPKDCILDPSYGGAVFLHAAIQKLQAAGSISAERQVYGVDSDPSAQARAQTKNRIPKRQLVTADFLSVRPKDFACRFDAVVGNPPYVKHHDIGHEALRVARRSVEEQGFKLSGMSSYWAYFVLHALGFVAPGGKLALVLPGSFLHARYASVVRNAVQKSFGSVTVIAVDEQLFPDAKEESILLLAKRKGKEPCELRIGGVSKQFLSLEEENLSRCTRKLFKDEQDQSWMRGMMDQAALNIYDGVLPLLPKLGEVATVRIGAVTGSNRYFTLKPSELKEAGVPRRYARPIITRASQLASCVLKKTDVQTLLKADAKALLFSPPLNGRLHPKVLEYIKLGESLGVPTKSKCAGRRPWYRVPGSSPPDAFLLYMAETASRVVLNSAGASCTNAIHALNWRDPKSVRPENVALASLTTLTQLAAELEGRSYGDGVLKLEPSEAARLPLPIIRGKNLEHKLAQADKVWRDDKPHEATRLADSALLFNLLSLADLKMLRRTLHDLRERRLRRASSRRNAE